MHQKLSASDVWRALALNGMQGKHAHVAVPECLLPISCHTEWLNMHNSLNLDQWQIMHTPPSARRPPMLADVNHANHQHQHASALATQKALHATSFYACPVTWY